MNRSRFWCMMGLTYLAVSAGCLRDTGGAEGTSWTVRDSAGVRIVHSQRPAAAPGCITVGPSPTAVLGAASAFLHASPPLFRVSGGTVLEDGRIVLLNAGTSQLLMYSRDGEFQRAFGGRGQGPGEFMGPSWLARTRGDTLAVWDPQLNRLTRYTAKGEVVATEMLRLSDGAEGARTITGRFGDGSFLVSPGGLAFLPETREGVTRFPEHFSRHHPEEDRTTVLAQGHSMEWVVDSERGMYSLPFGRSDVAVVGDNVVLVADTGVPRLLVHDLTGELRQIIEWRAAEMPVRDADRQAYAAYYSEVNPRLRVDERTPFPALRPYFSAIHFDALGRLWIQNHSEPWEGRSSWLVFDPHGVLQCEVSGPGRLRVLEIGETHKLAVGRDAMDEPTVFSYPVVRRDRESR